MCITLDDLNLDNGIKEGYGQGLLLNIINIFT
jgi:hypothetical protein